MIASGAGKSGGVQTGGRADATARAGAGRSAVTRRRAHRAAVAVSCLLAVAASGRIAGAATGDGGEQYRVVGALRDVSPSQDAYRHARPIVEPPGDRAVGAVLSLGSMMFNAVIFPVKAAVGLVGAELGGAAGFMTGGDSEAASGIWNVTTDGSYGVTPSRLDGRSEFEFVGTPR